MKTPKVILLSLIAVFAPVKQVLITAIVLVVIDLITGVMAAKKRGESITSAQLRRSVTKFFIYELGLLCAFLVEQYLTGPEIPAQKIIASFIGITELQSIMENLNTISGTNLLKSLIQKLGSSNAVSNDNK